MESAATVTSMVTRSAGDSAPGARGTVCLGAAVRFPLNMCVRVCELEIQLEALPGTGSASGTLRLEF